MPGPNRLFNDGDALSHPFRLPPLCGLGHADIVDRVPSIRRHGVFAEKGLQRRRWMLATLARRNRIADMAAIGKLMTSTSFPAATSILTLGGPVALLGAPDLGRRIVAALPTRWCRTRRPQRSD